MNKVYDDIAYGDLGYPELHEHLLPLLQPSQTVLDIGFGAGHMCSPVAFANLNIVGLDHNLYGLEHALKCFKEAGLDGLLTIVNAEALGYLQENVTKYNLVMMSDFLMFQRKTDGREMMRLAYDAVQPSGYIWITALSTGDAFYGAMIETQESIDEDTFLSYSPCGGAGPVCFYHPLEIEYFLQSLGAKIVFQTETMNSAGGMVNIILAQK